MCVCNLDVSYKRLELVSFSLLVQPQGRVLDPCYKVCNKFYLDQVELGL